MTPLGKMIFATLSIALVVGATLALREKPPAAAAPARLTPAQLAEMQPSPKAAEPPRAVPGQDADGGAAAEPDEPQFEDGSGS